MPKSRSEATTDHLMPDPEVWPCCTVCHVDAVMRRAMTLDGGYVWVWMHDCAHKRVDMALVSADGVLVQ